MSRSPGSQELRIALCPEQLTLLTMTRRSIWRARLRRTVHDAYSVPCAPQAGAPAWRGALQELETALPGYAERGLPATLILSNRFVRYAIVPWRPELADADEELAFARHCFAKTYGDGGPQWELRVSQESGAHPRLACAVDTELLDALRAVFGRTRIPLRSIQPHLMAAFNAFRGTLRRRSAWFALLEPGNLCLVLLRQGHWQGLRSVRIGDAWQAELPLILEREAYLSDAPVIPHEVYVWNAGPGATTIAGEGDWAFHALDPSNGESAADADPLRHFAWAMAG
ncbi:MAG: hypothetical protein ACM3KD_09180 [Hyphomicrobiaceae bacterium]